MCVVDIICSQSFQGGCIEIFLNYEPVNGRWILCFYLSYFYYHAWPCIFCVAYLGNKSNADGGITALSIMGLLKQFLIDTGRVQEAEGCTVKQKLSPASYPVKESIDELRSTLLIAEESGIPGGAIFVSKDGNDVVLEVFSLSPFCLSLSMLSSFTCLASFLTFRSISSPQVFISLALLMLNGKTNPHRRYRRPCLQ
jgi:hypothetical protein